jgi:hypothetical protein
MATKRSPPFTPPDAISSFSPSDLWLQGVFEEARRELQHDHRPIKPEREQLTREILAHRVTTQGERDANRLKQHAVRWMNSQQSVDRLREAIMHLILAVAVVTLLSGALYFGGDYTQSAFRQLSIIAQEVSGSAESYRPVEG